jgi:hypothetical protein
MYLPLLPGVSNQLSGSAVTANVLYSLPFDVPGTLVGESIELNVYSGGTNALARLWAAVFDVGGDLDTLPRARIALGGELVGVTQNTFQKLMDFTPPNEGPFWFALVSSVSPTLCLVSPGRVGTVLGYAASISMTGGISVAYSYAAPPVTWPAGATPSLQPPLGFASRA